MCYTIQFKHSKQHGEVNLVIQISVSEHVSKQSVTKTHLAYCRLKEVSIEAQTAFVPGCKHGEWPLSHTRVGFQFSAPGAPTSVVSYCSVCNVFKKPFSQKGRGKNPMCSQNNFYFHTCVFPAVTCSEKACGILASSSTVISPTSLTLQLVKTKIIWNLKLSLGWSSASCRRETFWFIWRCPFFWHHHEANSPPDSYRCSDAKIRSASVAADFTSKHCCNASHYCQELKCHLL